MIPTVVLDRSFDYGAALHILMKDIDLAIAQGEELARIMREGWRV